MIKRYRSTCDDSGIEVVLDVDHDVLTPELAREINAFWTDADWRLLCAGDNPVIAVIRLAAQALMYLLLEDLPGDTRTAMREFRALEGWPADCGITLVEFDGVPDIDSIAITVVEVPR
jgi:hypothetical protein